MLKSDIINQRILDFGCGAGGFLQLAQPLVDKVLGIKPELRVSNHWRGKMDVVNEVPRYFQWVAVAPKIGKRLGGFMSQQGLILGVDSNCSGVREMLPG